MTGAGRAWTSGGHRAHPVVSLHRFGDCLLGLGPRAPDPGNPTEEIGTDPPPITNTPNRSGEDPHSDPRVDPQEMQMVSDFLQPDAQSHITDTCGGLPCFAGDFNGP